jgi:hypothetical protein
VAAAVAEVRVTTTEVRVTTTEVRVVISEGDPSAVRAAASVEVTFAPPCLSSWRSSPATAISSSRN